jgi:hypothetical protein
MAARLESIFGTMTSFERETVVNSLGLLNEAVAKAGKVDEPLGGTIACCK